MATKLDFLFTEQAQRALSFAQEEAQSLSFTYIGTEHLLLGLLREDSIASHILFSLGADLPRVRQAVLYIVGPDQRVTNEKVDLSPRTKRVIELASIETKRLGAQNIDTAHLLLGLTRDSNGVATYVLTYLGISMDAVRQRTIEVLTQDELAAEEDDTEGDAANPLLDQLGIDLTAMAKQGVLDPVIGREQEINRIIQILRRRTKNNPALIGEPGVGKTALVEGLAQQIALDPNNPLYGKRVWMLDIAALVAGAVYRGQFEERLKRVVDEIQRTDTILFVDEFHALLGIGNTGGVVDAANLLKPILATGKLKMIGATTVAEYRKHIEKDTTLERRFQPVIIEEPTVSETIDILEGLRERYEAHHQLIITDQALQAAANLSARYITERFLPDKALDLIDEGASRAWLNRYSKVTITEELQAEWERRLDDIRQGKWTEIDHVLTEQDIAEVASQWTGIPVTHMIREETQRLSNMESVLQKQIIGQEEAVRAISRAVRLARAGLKHAHRPIGSFLFVGPTGVGKTLMGKAIAKLLLGDEKALIKIDMSEFMERHNVSRLVGSPPGYVGYDEGGQLTEAVRRRPYSVLLFDEVDKAHPEAINLLLQILEDGHLTEATGRTVSFQNAVVLLTANVGSNLLKLHAPVGFAKNGQGSDQQELRNRKQIDYPHLKENVHKELKNRFSPEFLNRLDEIVVFRPLAYEDLRHILDVLLTDVHMALHERDVVLELTDAAKDHLVEQGYDPKLGARPLRRTINNLVSAPISELLVENVCQSGDAVVIDYQQQDGTYGLVFLNRFKEPYLLNQTSVEIGVKE